MLGKRIFISTLLVIIALSSISRDVYSAEDKSNIDKYTSYIDILSKGALCIPIDEYSKKFIAVYKWIDNAFSEEKDAFGSLFGTTVKAKRTKYINEQAYENCQQIISHWNDTKWPDIDIENPSQAVIDELLEVLSPWTCFEERARIDGRRSISCISSSTISLPTSKGRDTGSIVLRCMDNKTNAYITWPNFLGRPGSAITVETRINNNPIEKRKWYISDDGEAIFNQNHIGWIKSLKNGKTLIVRIQPYKRGYEELEFDLTGINDVIDKVSEACKWKK